MDLDWVITLFLIVYFVIPYKIYIEMTINVGFLNYLNFFPKFDSWMLKNFMTSSKCIQIQPSKGLSTISFEKNFPNLYQVLQSFWFGRNNFWIFFNISENKNNIISVELAKVLRYICTCFCAWCLHSQLRLTPFFIFVGGGGWGVSCFFLFVSLKYLFGQLLMVSWWKINGI